MDQFGLFGNNEYEVVVDQDGECLYYPNFFEENFFSQLKHEINWRQDQITLFGKTHDIPRLHAWYNDSGDSYEYSKVTLPVNEFTSSLKIVRSIIETKLGIYFNSCLCNLYRHGRDYAAIHSDDEPELGKNPMIASVSFGVTRKFTLKHKTNKGIEKKVIELEDKSLLLMRGSLQHHWKHELPKSLKVKEERINLTFRNIIR